MKTESDHTKAFQRVMADFPLEVEEAAKIQEALKYLGYEVYGYRKKTNNIVLHLKHTERFIQTT